MAWWRFRMLDNSVLAWYHEVISSARFGLPACGLFFG
jgi:hypothetical protein